MFSHIDGPFPLHWQIDHHCCASWSDLFATEPPMPIVCSGVSDSVKTVTGPPSNASARRAMLDFLKRLEPSCAVMELMADIPPGTVGWHIRRLSWHGHEFAPVDVPAGDFAATDWLDQTAAFRPGVIWNRGVRTNQDLGRSVLEMRTAAADWFCLMRCRAIIQIGFGKVHHPEKNTFLQAHRMLGIPVRMCWPHEASTVRKEFD